MDLERLNPGLVMTEQLQYYNKTLTKVQDTESKVLLPNSGVDR